jgi:Domain of unknown function (DUF4134)
MKQLVNQTQGQRFLALSLLFLVPAGVGLTATSQIFRIIVVSIIALVGIIGAIKVHKKLKSGAADIQATALNWFGSFLILTILNTVMQSLFGQ